MMDFNDQEKNLIAAALRLFAQYKPPENCAATLLLRDKVLGVAVPDGKPAWIVESETRARRLIDGAIIRPYAITPDSIIGFAAERVLIHTVGGVPRQVLFVEPLESGTLTAAMAECDKRWPA
jgi:hypothetical protein